MIRVVAESAQARRTGLAPVVAQEGTMTEVNVRDVLTVGAALNPLYQLDAPVALACERERAGRIKGNEAGSERTGDGRDWDPLNPRRVRVLELGGKHGEVDFTAERLDDAKLAASWWALLDNGIVHDGDAGSASLVATHLGS
jgi:hypothetical protein